MNKNDKIITLYNQIAVRGAKVQAWRDIADMCNRGVNTVKNHWFGSQEFPEEFQDMIISHLEEVNQSEVA